ncbi:hypothetical protein [Parathalassolituus penaei]|uniref:Uncharacterized protein n=1 Tax=Parathalassolituus penaei TaxID=2997323 RepID=A0A9X3IT17_9GAMM|nr:hypothetical protein [Parathalassolituus penaei]MCY0964733.1 hypothetical protein [Parathalassolituus penaei]
MAPNHGKDELPIPEWLLLLLITLAVIGFFVGCAVTGTDPSHVFLMAAGWLQIGISLAGIIGGLVLILAILLK